MNNRDSLKEITFFTFPEPHRTSNKVMATNYAHFSRYNNPYPSDHWSKLKVKSLRLAQLPSGNVTVLCAPKVQRIKRHRHSLDMSELQAHRTVSRVGSARLQGELQGQLPPLCLSRQLSTPKVRGRQPPNEPVSTANDRARMGFKYWMDESKGNPGVKITMGSRGTYLGLGVPRL